jgi:hypothetical protein
LKKTALLQVHTYAMGSVVTLFSDGEERCRFIKPRTTLPFPEFQDQVHAGCGIGK